MIGTLLGAAGLLGLAFGFAFRDIVENYLAGILLALRRPFGGKDIIQVDDAIGTVVRMTASETTLLDPDGNHLRIPNSMIFKSRVRNYTRNPLRRFTVGIGVGVDVDLLAAQELGLETLRRMTGVVAEPPPSVRAKGLGDSNVELEFYGWVDQRESSFLKVASEAIRLVKTAMDRAGVDMPVPTYRVVLQRPGSGSITTAQQRPKSTDEQQNVQGDVSPEYVIEQQIDRERAAAPEADLLGNGA